MLKCETLDASLVGSGSEFGWCGSCFAVNNIFNNIFSGNPSPYDARTTRGKPCDRGGILIIANRHGGKKNNNTQYADWHRCEERREERGRKNKKQSSANKLLTNATMNVRAARWTREHETKNQHREKNRPNDATWIDGRR